MKKNHLLKELVIFFILALFFFFFELVGWFKPLKVWGDRQLVFLLHQQVLLVNRMRQPYEFVTFLFSKYRYTKQLEVKYSQVQAELSELHSLKKEVLEFKEILGKGEDVRNSIVTVPVVSLAYPAVGVGSRDGVRDKAMVLSSGVLLGTVYDVGESDAKVSLLTQARKDRVLVETEGGVQGVLEGTGKSILLTQVPRGKELKQLERVVAIGQEGITKGTYIGTIRLLDNNPADPTQTAVIDQGVGFYSSVLVEIK